MASRVWLAVMTLVTTLCALPQTVAAEAPAGFVRLRDRAETVESLGGFLERYVGSCSAPEERAACLANARKARNELTNKVFYVALDTDATRMLKAGRFDPATREFTFEMTPIFEGAGLALTNGAPNGQDLQGRPRIKIEPVTVTLPLDQMPMDMERHLRTMNIRIHLVFKPQGTWSLPGKSGNLEGVKARFLAVRLTNARNGEEIGLKLYEP